MTTAGVAVEAVGAGRSGSPMPAPAPGIFPGMPFRDYFALEAVNHTLLERVLRSPAHARQEMLHPREPSEALALGHAFHARLLEPDVYARDYVVPPKVDRRTKDGRARWAAFEQENPGRLLIKAEEAWCYEAMARAILDHPTAGALVAGGRGLSELSAVWLDAEAGLTCKGRIDRLGELAGFSYIVDVKTTRDASHRAFAADVARYGYHRQLAHYRRGLDVLRPASRRAAVVAIEKEPPFAVACYELTDRALDQGDRENARALAAYRECLETGVWPGYASGLELLELPAWAVDRLDE